MPFPYIDSLAKTRPEKPLELGAPLGRTTTDPAGYLLESALADAVNVALLLGQPLLLTGEPGTGKTQLAHRLAWQLGLAPPPVFDTKSTSTARDLLYTFDAMHRLHMIQSGQGKSEDATTIATVDYITYAALGIAMLQSQAIDNVRALLPKSFTHCGPQRSLVLVDEIDKAPRDFSNDLLHEVDEMAFRVFELQNTEIRADPAWRPILVLTSNSERNLPDAFLRRCIFFNIPFPSDARLVDIIDQRLPGLPKGAGSLTRSALDFFLDLRAANLRKPPSTAELLNWLQALIGYGANKEKPLKASPDALQRSQSTLAKTPEDVVELQKRIDSLLKP